MTRDPTRDVDFFSKIAAAFRPKQPVVEDLATATQPIVDAQTDNRFHVALLRVKSSKYYKPRIEPNAPYGYFNGRPIIGEATKIHGGIFLSSAPVEAIVIDEKYGFLSELYEELAERLNRLSDAGVPSERLLLHETFKFVLQKARFDPEKVDRILARNKFSVDTKVILDAFVKEGVGLHRHQALLAAYLLERLCQEKTLRGSVQIDPQNSPSEQIIYLSPDGTTTKFDPASFR